MALMRTCKKLKIEQVQNGYLVTVDGGYGTIGNGRYVFDDLHQTIAFVAGTYAPLSPGQEWQVSLTEGPEAELV
jgi:hypothetical protein